MEPEHHKDGVVSCELEAAEALARLARCAAAVADASRPTLPLVQQPRVASSAHTPQDQALAAEQFCGKTSTVITSVLETNGTVRIVPSQLCSTNFPSNSTCKSRKRLTEAEKEERQLRRVLANRESARQTIRRRQAMHLELTRKAADLLDENKNLKKEKELAMKKYNTLKQRNEFLKLQISKIKENKLSEIQEEPNSSRARLAGSAAMCAPFLSYNQPVVVPLFSDIPFLHGGQDVCSGYTGRGNPLFILPVPWFIPCLGHSKAFYSDSDTNRGQNGTISSQQQSMASNLGTLLFKGQNSREMVSNSTNVIPERSACGSRFTCPANVGDHYTGHQISSCTRPVEKLRSGRHSHADDTNDTNTLTAPKHMSQGLSLKNKKKNPVFICHKRISEDVVAASNARKRRKELMTLKNTNLRNFQVHNTSG